MGKIVFIILGFLYLSELHAQTHHLGLSLHNTVAHRIDDRDAKDEHGQLRTNIFEYKGRYYEVPRDLPKLIQLATGVKGLSFNIYSGSSNEYHRGMLEGVQVGGGNLKTIIENNPSVRAFDGKHLVYRNTKATVNDYCQVHDLTRGCKKDLSILGPLENVVMIEDKPNFALKEQRESVLPLDDDRGKNYRLIKAFAQAFAASKLFTEGKSPSFSKAMQTIISDQNQEDAAILALLKVLYPHFNFVSSRPKEAYRELSDFSQIKEKALESCLSGFKCMEGLKSVPGSLTSSLTKIFTHTLKGMNPNNVKTLSEMNEVFKEFAGLCYDEKEEQRIAIKAAPFRRFLKSFKGTIEEMLTHDRISPKSVIRSASEKRLHSVKIDVDQEIKPGEFIYVEIPAEYHDQELEFVAIEHRNPVNYGTPLTSLQYLDTDSPECPWRVWNYRYGRNPWGSKFAEPRRGGNPEGEAYHHLHQKGHRCVDDDNEPVKKKPLRPKMLRITNVGRDKVDFRSVDMKFHVANFDGDQDFSMSRSFSFGDLLVRDGLSYGSGRPFPMKPGDAPHGTIVERGKLQVPIDPSRNLEQIYVAIGDGGGSGKLNMVLVRPNDKRELIMENENIPPQGVLFSSPHHREQWPAGSYIELSNPASWATIYGVRLRYSK